MNATPSITATRDLASRGCSGRIILLIFLVVALGGVAVLSPHALLFSLLDLPWALAALLPGAALGMVLLPIFRMGEVSRSWHFILSAALGIGLWCQLILALGLLGWLDRGLFLGIVGAALVYLILRWRSMVHGDAALGHAAQGNQQATGSRQPRRSRDFQHATVWTRWLWLLAAPFLTLSILAAANAPGFLWKEEAFGYDVLEYHLQLPREYIDAGRISYAGHNVYANFPANVEMLYLAAMILTGSPQDAGTVCHLIHLLLGVMTVAAIWRAGREWSPRAGVMAGVVAGTVGWAPYLSGLAYVELGMLFFGAAAMACVIRFAEKSRKIEKSKNRNDLEGHEAIPARPDCAPPGSHEGNEWGWIVLAGLFAGFACGCKYTALPMVAAPVGLALMVMYRGTMADRAKAGTLFALATLVAFSPWLVKNAVMTGNPVFPLAQRVFHATPPGWGEVETQRWNRGHLPRADKDRLPDRLAALWRNLPGDHHQRFGPAVIALALLGFLFRRPSRADVGLMVMLILQVLVWTFATHLFARFAVVMLIPLALLCARALPAEGIRLGGALLACVVAGAAWNFYFAARLHVAETPEAAPAALLYEGKVPGFEYLGYINHELPKDARILMVGDARPFYIFRDIDYCVVFNRSPFIAAVENAQQPADVVSWLRGQGYTHVLVHWMEMERLRRTYGFSEKVNAELFDEWENHGLRKLREFSVDGVSARYISLYEIVGR